MEGGAGSALDAVIGPQRLRPVGGGDGLEGPPAGMRTGKGTVPRRVPVLGERRMRKARAEAIHHRYDLVAAGNGERAARAEIILEIDDEEKVSVGGLHRPRPVLTASVLLS